MVYITTEIPTMTIENGKVKTVRKIGFTNDMKGYKKRLSFPQTFLADKIDVHRAFTSKMCSDHKIEHLMHAAAAKFKYTNTSNSRELFCINDDQIDNIVLRLRSTSIPDLIELNRSKWI